MPLLILLNSALYVLNGYHLIPPTWPVCSQVFDVAVWIALAISFVTCLEKCGIKIE